MKVLDLRCGIGHAFEGWFASEDDYGSQRERGLVDCPVCGNADVVRLPSAPRLNLSGARAPASETAQRDPQVDAGGAASSSPPGELYVHGNAAARFVEAVAELLKNTEDVGTRFAEEARRRGVAVHGHFGDARGRGGRGHGRRRELRGTRTREVEPRGARQARHLGVAADRAIEQAALALRAVVVLGGEPAFEAMAGAAAQVEHFHRGAFTRRPARPVSRRRCATAAA